MSRLWKQDAVTYVALREAIVLFGCVTFTLMTLFGAYCDHRGRVKGFEKGYTEAVAVILGGEVR